MIALDPGGGVWYASSSVATTSTCRNASGGVLADFAVQSSKSSLSSSFLFWRLWWYGVAASGLRCGQVYLTGGPFVKGNPWGVVGIWNSNTRLFPGQAQRALIEARFGGRSACPRSGLAALPNGTPSLRRWKGHGGRRGAPSREHPQTRRRWPSAPATRGRQRDRRGGSRRGAAGRPARRA